MSMFEDGKRPPTRALQELPESRIAVPRNLEPRVDRALQVLQKTPFRIPYVNPAASTASEKFFEATGIQILGDGTVLIPGTGVGAVAKIGTRVAATLPATFAANYYVAFTDMTGNVYYVPAMAAAW